MPVFPSEEWVRAWMRSANQHPQFKASGAGWSGSIGLVIDADPAGAVPDTTYICLVGCSGEWTDYSYGTSSDHVRDSVLTLRASYSMWKQVVSGRLNPVKGIVQGKVGLSGHLPEALKWAQSMMILAEVASGLDTDFVDEQ